MLLFFLTGLSFEIKRIIIAFWAFVKREIENILRKFGGRGAADCHGRGAPAMTLHKGGAVQARRVVQEADPYGRVIGGAVPGVRKKTRSGDVGIGPYGV